MVTARSGPADEAVEPSLRRRTLDRLRALEFRPSRELGQNFLVDERYLDVVEGAAELSASDAVLEVGGGLGALSARLAPRVAHLHVAEIDRRLASLLRRELSAFENVTVHEGDVVRLDLGRLVPEPSKLVANLPYGVAATVLLKAIEELAGAVSFVAMVQREVAERLAAAPGSRTYGATSVLAQLACDVRLERRVPRSAFHPAPNVGSAIVVLRRRRPPPAPLVRELVRAAFAHRRKTLAGSLALAGGSPPARADAAADADAASTREHTREHTREALVALGHPPDARAERLSPGELERLALALHEEREASER